MISVDLSSTKVTDQHLVVLRELKELKWLNLARTQVTDNCVEHLVGLVELKRLVLSTTQVSDSGMKQLKQALPNAAIIT